MRHTFRSSSPFLALSARAAVAVLLFSFLVVPARSGAQPSGLSDYDAFGGPRSKKGEEKAPAVQAPQQPPVAPPTTGQPGVQTPEEVEKRISDVIKRGKEILGAGTASSSGASDPTSDTVGYRDQPGEDQPRVEPPAPSPPPPPAVNVDPSLIISREMPRDPRFARFRDWYRNHSVVSLIVNGENREHLIENLEKLVELRDQNNVILGDIAVIGGLANIAPIDLAAGAQRSPGSDRVTLKASEFSRYRSALALDPPKLEDGSEIIARYGITYSPAWVIRYRGKDYVFEGNFDPARLFSRQGAFLQGEDSQ